MMKSCHAKGFTLLELLIALSVFSILSVMAYSGLQIVLNSREHTEKQADRLVELQRAFTFIGRDIEQTVGRSIRDSFGDPKGALIGSNFGTIPLELTRAGWRNPAKLTRSSLERVMYRYDEENLSRLSVLALDQGSQVEPLERHLLSEVKELSLRYLDEALSWHDTWPPGIGEETDLSRLPRAVEVTVNLSGFGEVKRIFRVSPGEYVTKNKAPKNKQGNNGSNNANNNSGGGNNTNQSNSDETGNNASN
jgi:general secretion pathway protein J